LRRIGAPTGWIAAGALLVLCGASLPVSAQPDVRVVAGDVTDARFRGGYRTGGLSLKVKVRGDGMDGVRALRFLLADARDDLGKSLLPETGDEPPFREVRGDMADENLSLRSPAREASSFSVSGRVELFFPGRDPNAVVKVPGALAGPNKPLSSPGLKAAGVHVTVLARTRTSKNVLSLRGPAADLDRIRSIRILRSDGTEVRVGSTARLSDGEVTVMTLEATEPVPGNASLVFTILTDKARVSVPFALKEIPLP
jgi:hypothetical protein